MQDARALELFDSLARIAEIASKYFFVVLAEQRGAAACRLGKAGEVERKPGQIEAAKDRIVDGRDRAALAKMWKLERFVGREHGCGRHAILCQTLHHCVVAG